MKKLSIFLALSLIFGGKAFAQYELEYIFDSLKNKSPCIRFNDIFELDNGDFIITGKDLAKAGPDYFCRFTSSGELLAEKRFEELLIPGYHLSDVEGSRILTDNNGGFYMFFAYNPILDTTNSEYVPGIFDAKLMMKKINSDFDIVSSKEVTVSIDTNDWQNLWSRPGAYFPRICVGSVVEKENEGFLICYEKNIGHELEHHLWSHGKDSTFFLKTDYDLNILKSGYYEHTKCNMLRHKNHLIYDSEYDKYLYYTSINYDGFYVREFDSDFNLIKEKILKGTNGTGYHDMALRDATYEMDGITLKRTAEHTTIIGAGTIQHHLHNNTILCTFAASCLEIDDNATLIDSMNYASHEPMSGIERTSVPTGCSIDWVDEDRIFIGAIPFADAVPYFLPKFQYLSLRLLDRNFNTVQELYYDMGKDSTALWINTLKATSDGGCIVAGHFRNYVEDPYNNFHRAFHSVVKKFPPDAFDGIDEAHDNGLKVAIAYPNPGNSQLNIRTALSNSYIKVYDLNGKIIHKQELSDNITSINAESWPPGVYVWKVVSDGKEAESGKWVKE